MGGVCVSTLLLPKYITTPFNPLPLPTGVVCVKGTWTQETADNFELSIQHTWKLSSSLACLEASAGSRLNKVE